MENKQNLGCVFLILLFGIFCTFFGALNNGVKNIAFNGIKPVVPEKERQYHKVINKKKFVSIEVDVKRARIKILPGNEYSIRYQGKRANLPRISIDDNHLMISQTNNILSETTHSIHWKESSNVDRDNSIITITVPAKTKLHKIRIFNNYGTTSVLNIDTSVLEITEMEGGVVLKKVAADAVDLEAHAGRDMYLENVNLANGQIQNTQTNLNFNNGLLKDVIFDIDQGSIDADSLIADNTMINSNHGNVTLNKLKIRNKLTINTQNGNNTINNSNIDNYKLNVQNGKNQLFNNTQVANNQMQTLNQIKNNKGSLKITTINGNNVVK
nr:DUF4097 family beta strand repeat-containing protein [uncultured Ligilactobacillus sp.]